jgi:AAA15 family ATPase/GTPase
MPYLGDMAYQTHQTAFRKSAYRPLFLPTMLKRVSIQNFKSLKDVTLDLQKVNLLIGPNNSGKTNFLKALESFSFDGLRSQNIDVLEAISYKHKRVDITYEFDYIPDPNGYMILNDTEKKISIYHCIQKSVVQNDNWTGSIENVPDDWFINEFGEKIDTLSPSHSRREFADFIKTKVYRPDPSKLIQQVKFSADHVELLADCSNLISFYFYVDSNFKQKAKKIQDNLSRCIPEISYFTLPPVKVGNDSMLGLRFFDKDEYSYWADEVSEGVLYFLALLCIINQPNPPKLLLLEEPEKGIHPRRIWEVMKLIFQLAEEKDIQIILTTHNEHIVNTFSTIPESVFVFDKDDDGATYVRNLQKDIIDVTDRKSEELGLDKIDLTSNLGENWLYGLIGGVPSDEL